MSASDLLRDPTRAWEPHRPSSADPWDRAKAAHLRRRAALGGTEPQIRRDLSDGYELTLRHILDGDVHGPDGRPAMEFDAVAEAMANSARGDPSLIRLQSYWLYRMLFTPRPLEERLALAWHGHYACGIGKASAGDLWTLNEGHRRLGRGRISELHRFVLRSPAMLAWLDGVGTSPPPAGRPNENLGREFLELFALGEGSYSERDVREAARALTGWQEVPANARRAIVHLDHFHDSGLKTILGETGRWSDADLVRIVCRQPAAARHVAGLLYRTFVADIEKPPPGLVEALAAAMRLDDDVDIGKGVETVLRSRLFHSEWCRGQRVKGPVEYVVGALRSCQALEPPPDPVELERRLEKMGQRLFDPPSVSGWQGGLAWLRAPAIIARAGFAALFVDPTSAFGPTHLLTVARNYGWDTPQKWVRGFGELLCGPAAAQARVAEVAKLANGTSDPSQACGRIVQAILSSPEGQLA